MNYIEMEQVSEAYKKYESLSETARHIGISVSKVRKILIILGEYENETSQIVMKLYNSGMTVNEIAKELDCSTTCVNSYLPYCKGLYNSVSPSQNALNIRIHRKKPLIF